MISSPCRPQFSSSCVRLRSALQAMARLPALLLLAALAVANVKTGLAGCRGHEWQCANEQCIDGAARCNGRMPPDCSDGSDEEAAMCDKAPSIRMQVGQVTTAQVQYKYEHDAVEFHLCNATSCSQLWLLSHTADGGMWYQARTDGNARGWGGNIVHRTEPKFSEDFRPGPVVFVAERRPDQLVVWMDGHEDKAAWAPVKDDYDLLRIRPWKWSSDLAVEFGLWCANGGTLSEGACICKPGFVGVSCQQGTPRDVVATEEGSTQVASEQTNSSLPAAVGQQR